MIKIIIGVIVAAILTLAGLFFIAPSGGTTSGGIAEINDPNTLKVAISGEVENEGTFTVETNTTLKDLIEKAGGVTSNADQRTYYEEIVVESGHNYYISGIYNPNDICNNQVIEKVNINLDDADTLMSINGISPSVASSIVSYRQTDGQFTSLEDLLNVYGIGNATYKRIRDYVYLHE